MNCVAVVHIMSAPRLLFFTFLNQASLFHIKESRILQKTVTFGPVLCADLPSLVWAFSCCYITWCQNWSWRTWLATVEPLTWTTTQQLDELETEPTKEPELGVVKLDKIPEAGLRKPLRFRNCQRDSPSVSPIKVVVRYSDIWMSESEKVIQMLMPGLWHLPVKEMKWLYWFAWPQEM